MRTITRHLARPNLRPRLDPTRTRNRSEVPLPDRFPAPATGEQGDRTAQFELAFALSKETNGDRDAPNYEEAVKWWREAALRGDARAGLAALLKRERDRQESEQRMIRGMSGVATLHSLLPERSLIFPASPIDPSKPRRHGPISKRFSARAAKVGFGGLRFHDLRHTHATLLLQAGVPVAAVSARLGHANAAVTLGIYSHATTDAEAAAALVAGSLLSNVLKGR